MTNLRVGGKRDDFISKFLRSNMLAKKGKVVHYTCCDATINIVKLKPVLSAAVSRTHLNIRGTCI